MVCILDNIEVLKCTKHKIIHIKLLVLNRSSILCYIFLVWEITLDKISAHQLLHYLMKQNSSK